MTKFLQTIFFSVYRSFYCGSAIDAFAEHEKLIIGARTKAALQAKKVRNERVGTIPFGFELSNDGKTLIENASEQMIILAIREYKKAGLSLRSIVTRLADQKMVSRARKPLGLTQIARLVNG